MIVLFYKENQTKKKKTIGLVRLFKFNYSRQYQLDRSQNVQTTLSHTTVTKNSNRKKRRNYII